jgi:DNA recombination protein RmuC
MAKNDCDSKVSLTAYEKYINEEDDEVKVGFKEHVNSIKRHVEQLGNKNYQDLYKLKAQILYYYLFLSNLLLLWHSMGILVCTTRHSKNIVIVTPATLLATLRTIDSMWTNQKQQENALEIARQLVLCMINSKVLWVI